MASKEILAVEDVLSWAYRSGYCYAEDAMLAHCVIHQRDYSIDYQNTVFFTDAPDPKACVGVIHRQNSYQGG